jgi:phosphoglycolate phosphatase/pyrophosphatase PpaX
MNFLFDLDGTLGNTLPLCIHAFHEALEPIVKRPLSDAEIIAHFGPSEEGLMQALVPEHYDEGLDGYIACYRRLHREYTQRPFEGMTEILRFLKDRGAFVGMVTGKGERSARITLEIYGVAQYFDCVKTGAARGPIKDECIAEIIASRSDPKESYLYVGDSPADVDACRKVGIKIVAAGWAATTDCAVLRAKNPDFFFATVPEFRAFVESRFATR